MICPSFCADRSQQGGEESWGTTEEVGHKMVTAEEKARVATYGSINGACAIKHFSKELGKDLKENMVRDWIKAYQELRRKRTLADIGPWESRN